jgi:hypothetical protein
VGGIAVPIWLWQADLAARSLALSVVQTIPLQPTGTSAPGKLEVSIDGQLLATPHLSLIEIENTGKRPIAATDFDGPIEIRVASGQSIARARVAEAIPSDLEAKLVAEQEKISVFPLLLNPGDRMRIAIVTSGPPPKYSSRVRIAGVTSAAINDVSNQKRSPGLQLTIGIYGFALLVASMLFIWRALDLEGVFVRARAAVFVALLTFFLAIGTIVFILTDYGYDSFWYFMLGTLFLSAIASPIAAWLNQPQTAIPPK